MKINENFKSKILKHELFSDFVCRKILTHLVGFGFAWIYVILALKVHKDYTILHVKQLIHDYHGGMCQKNGFTFIPIILNDLKH